MSETAVKPLSSRRGTRGEASFGHFVKNKICAWAGRMMGLYIFEWSLL
jgi:hypothetical protein